MRTSDEDNDVDPTIHGHEMFRDLWKHRLMQYWQDESKTRESQTKKELTRLTKLYEIWIRKEKKRPLGAIPGRMGATEVRAASGEIEDRPADMGSN